MRQAGAPGKPQLHPLQPHCTLGLDEAKYVRAGGQEEWAGAGPEETWFPRIGSLSKVCALPRYRRQVGAGWSLFSGKQAS